MDDTNARARGDAGASEQIEALAAELKHQRRRQSLSLEQLASMSGVSRSMISKIERGEAVPSTVILSRLAESLGVTFAKLMLPAAEREILVIPASVQPVLRDQASGFQRRCLSPVLPGRGIDWVLNTLPPGSATGEFTAHRRGVEEYIYVLRGRLRATIGERMLILSEGDSLYFEADLPHAFSNPDATACEYFLVIDSNRAR
ncbi:MAG: helix-turn-helix domain-containing protein [Janthinobacterium lividum]